MFTTPLTYVVTSIFPKVYNTFLLVLEDSVIPLNPKAPEDDFGSIEVNDVPFACLLEITYWTAQGLDIIVIERDTCFFIQF